MGKKITQIPTASAINADDLLFVGNPVTGNLFKTTVSAFISSIGSQLKVPFFNSNEDAIAAGLERGMLYAKEDGSVWAVLKDDVTDNGNYGDYGSSEYYYTSNDGIGADHLDFFEVNGDFLSINGQLIQIN